LIAPIEAQWSISTIAPLSLATIWHRKMPANWKLVIENFMDPYHIGFVHPESGSVRTHSLHKVSRPSRDIISQRTPGGAVDKPRSGPIPTIPQLEKVLGGDYQTFWLFPNTTMLAQPNFVSLRTMLPISADTSYQFNAIYVAEEAMAGQYEPERRRLM